MESSKEIQKKKLTDLFMHVTRGCDLAENEAEVSNVFETQIYHFLKDEYNIEPQVRKESCIDGLLHSFPGLSNRRSGQGRLDAEINDLIIEYKHHAKLNDEDDVCLAIHQVEDYLIAKKKHGNNERDAILTDGTRISYFSFLNGELCHTPLRRMTVDDIDKIIHAILSQQTKKFTAKNIVRDFSISSHSESRTKTLAYILFKELCEHATGKSLMLFSEWKSLIHLSIDDNGKSIDIEKRRRDLSEIFRATIGDTDTEYKALYALHTTYAVIVKLIACHVLSENSWNITSSADMSSEKMQQFFQRMEDGRAYRSHGIRNLLEGDFFSWYADKEQWCDDFCNATKQILATIEEYSAFSMGVRYAPTDIFKDLYMGIIPQSVRHSMGEYFTPEWLADSAITGALECIKKTDWRAIDPCCGSGIFLISLIRKIVGDTVVGELSHDDRQSLINEIVNRVSGVDINPLSILSARVSYYLALNQIGEVRNIEIPVYLGDSALVPILETVDGFHCYSYTIHNLKKEAIRVMLPKRLVESTDYGYLMDDVQSMVDTECEENVLSVFESKLSEQEKMSIELMFHIRNLAHSLVKLHQNNWDGIWVRIITNFMMVARMKQAELIVGNPPWVKWEHLPAAYTRRIKDFCDIRHIFCNDGGMFGGAQLNICALISNVVATNWLTKDGCLAFLMPDSIMSQNSYEEFRNFYIDYSKRKRLYLSKLDRWMPPLRPFKVEKKTVAQDFNTYYYTHETADYKKGIEVRVISKKKGVSDDTINHCQTWAVARRMLTVETSLARQLSANSTAFTFVSSEYDFTAIIGNSDYLYRTGVESTPFEIFKMTGVGKSSLDDRHYRFKNKQLKTSRYKVDDVPIDGWDFDTRYIYPMVEGPSVKPFEYNTGNSFHIIPYDEDNTQSPVPMASLYQRCNSLAIYFAHHKSLLDKQSEKSKSMHRGNEFYALSKIGPYTFAPNMVAARDNSTFCASVIYPTMTPWGELKQSICVKHTIIISQDTEGNFITEDEAHYINGILNSTIVKAYIHNTFKTNGFSLKKSHLYLPKYHADNKIQVRISNMSKEATQNADMRPSIMAKITDEYMKLCQSK